MQQPILLAHSNEDSLMLLSGLLHGAKRESATRSVSVAWHNLTIVGVTENSARQAARSILNTGSIPEHCVTYIGADTTIGTLQNRVFDGYVVFLHELMYIEESYLDQIATYLHHILNKPQGGTYPLKFVIPATLVKEVSYALTKVLMEQERLNVITDTSVFPDEEVYHLKKGTFQDLLNHSGDSVYLPDSIRRVFVHREVFTFANDVVLNVVRNLTRNLTLEVYMNAGVARYLLLGWK